MSIIGNSIYAGSSASAIEPYVEYTTTSNTITKIKLVGFQVIPNKFFPSNSADSVITEIDFSTSPNLTSIGEYAFYNRHGATASGFITTDFPDTITSIGTYAFYLSGVRLNHLPDSLTTLGTYAFYNCGFVNFSTFPDGVTSIPSYCFYNPAMTSLDFNNVTVINSNAFRAVMSPLTTIRSSKLKSIAASAFSGCNNLTTIYLDLTTPPTLANKNAFTSCPLEHIYVPVSAVSTYQSATNWSNWSSIISAIPT